jgi:hypothetical protein
MRTWWPSERAKQRGEASGLERSPSRRLPFGARMAFGPSLPLLTSCRCCLSVTPTFITSPRPPRSWPPPAGGHHGIASPAWDDRALCNHTGLSVSTIAQQISTGLRGLLRPPPILPPCLNASSTSSTPTSAPRAPSKCGPRRACLRW